MGFFARLILALAVVFRILFDSKFAQKVNLLHSGASSEAKEEHEKTKPRQQVAREDAVETEAEEHTGVRKASRNRIEEKREVVSPAGSGIWEAGPESALQLLALLQREGRFIDFLEEDLGAYSDERVGAAARVVHEGCRRAIREHFTIEPVISEEEGALVVIEKGYDPSRIHITGQVTGTGPFRGKVAHRGWRVKEVKLPKMTEGHDVTVIASAEIEV
ncbi:MAG: DUF2760 domain-containing protein [Sandaracinaceae bacterium]|nr:DUF2760 domain-containing protein [Sandaracinaceae bacterium]